MVAATRSPGANPVTPAPMCAHDPGHLAPRHERRRRLELVFALRDEHVGKFRARRFHVDEQLPRPRLGLGNVVDAEASRTDELVATNGAHGAHHTQQLDERVPTPARCAP